MKKNNIISHRAWTSVVLMLIATLSLSAQDDTTLAADIARRERVAEMMPSINLVSISTNKKSVALGGLSTIVREKAFGLQIGGLYNLVGDMGRGVAIAGLANTAMGSYYGVQIGGLWNYTASDAKGVMIGGLGNMVNDEACGMQISGLANIAKDMWGAQIAGLINSARGMAGLQLAGLMNVSREAKGLQFAGLANVARTAKGVQFAGLLNVARTAKGVQFAGLLNVAEESDFPIALVNIIKQGTKGIALTHDALGNRLVAFRSGGRYGYGIVGVGYNPQIAAKVAGEAGYGIHIPICPWLAINNEAKATAMVNTSMANFNYLLAPSVTLWQHCNLFGGPTINYFMSNSAEAGCLLPSNVLWHRKASDELQSALYIGYQVGLQYVF